MNYICITLILAAMLCFVRTAELNNKPFDLPSWIYCSFYGGVDIALLFILADITQFV